MPSPSPGTGEFPELAQHEDEPHGGSLAAKLNAMRAAVLGANDGIVSTAGLVMGVAGATSNSRTIFIAGVAGLVSGALSMAAGEYVSVSSQRDTEEALIAKETRELEEEPEEELAELADLYQRKGLSEQTAKQVAIELTEHDALRAHLDIELGIDPDELISPWHAAWASMLAFSIGALLPLLTITLVPSSIRVLATVVAVVLSLALTGFVSAMAGEAHRGRAIARNVGGGVLAMLITYGIGSLVGTGIA